MKSVLIIGLGRFGQHLCRKMVELGNEVMVVDIDEECVEEVMAEATSAQIGDCTKTAVLESLGIANFDLCFVCIGTNFQSSLEITSLVKEYGAKYVVSKATRRIHEKFLLRNGADEVVYPERDMAIDSAIRYSADHVYDYIGVDDQHSIYEISVVAEWVGKSLKELDFRDTYKVNILGIKKEGETTLLPMADYRFDGKEHLMIIGKREQVEELLKKLEHEKGKRNFR